MLRAVILLFVAVRSVMLRHKYMECIFEPGDGIGGNEVYVGEQKEKECIDACSARRLIDRTINGVTVHSDITNGGCWCESNMIGRDKSTYYKSCFMREPLPCLDNPCGPYGNCTVIENDWMYGYECQCQHGYSGDGKHCRDISNVTRGYTINCHETYVVATWSKASFDHANQIQISLNLPSCNKHQENSTHVWIMTNFTQCGSQIVESGDIMLQKNTAKITTTHIRNNLTIQQRKYSYKMECSFQRNQSVSTNLGYNVSDVVDTSVKKSRQTTFDLSMSFYHTSSFLQIIYSPFTVSSFQPIHVGLTQGNNNFKIIVHQCFATPSASTNGISDVFFHKKCPLDPTFRIIYHSNTKFLFTINAFKFIEVNGGVYMHCRIRICKANSSSDDCRQSCSMRKRRGIHDEHANQVNAIKEIVLTSPKISFDKSKCSNITCPLNSGCIKTAYPAKCRCNNGYVYNLNFHLCSNERVFQALNLPVDDSWLSDYDDTGPTARISLYEATEAKLMALFPTPSFLEGVKIIQMKKTDAKVYLDLLILYRASSDKKRALEELTDAVKAATPNKVTGHKVPMDAFVIIANDKPIEQQEVIGINHDTLIISTVIPVALVIIAFISVIGVKMIISQKQCTKSRSLGLNNPGYEKVPMNINE